jgi:polysaccharide biosynthesis PFTS motif protein
MEETDRTPRISIVNGRYIDDVSPNIVATAQQNRERLMENCDFVIAVYDNIFYEHRFYTPTVMSEFYNNLLDFAQEWDFLGLLIQPKRDSGHLEELEGVSQKLRDLEAENRCIVMDHRKLSVEAALAADLTVGVGINSAVFEGLTAGTPGIHSDLVGMERAVPYYDEGVGRFIFRDRDSLSAAILAYRNQEGRADVGEYGEWKQL